MVKAYVTLVCALLFHCEAFAECEAKSLEATGSYSKARASVFAIPDVKAWKKHVYAAGRKVVTRFDDDHQMQINGRCYWSVTLFEDTPENVIRWNTFYVPLKGKNILVENDCDETPMTLSQWHANSLSSCMSASSAARR